MMKKTLKRLDKANLNILFLTRELTSGATERLQRILNETDVTFEVISNSEISQEIHSFFDAFPNGKIPTNDSRDLNNKNVNPQLSKNSQKDV